MSDETELEQAFRKVYDEHHQEIQDKLKAASALIDEAVALAEKHGLPFRPNDDIMWCNPSYVPESFRKKFEGIDEDFVYDLCDAAYAEYEGWQVSQTC